MYPAQRISFLFDLGSIHTYALFITQLRLRLRFFSMIFIGIAFTMAEMGA